MARRPLSDATAERLGAADRFTVGRVPIDAREFHTLDVIRVGEETRLAVPDQFPPTGSFVRLRPGPGVDDGPVEALRRILEADHECIVVVLPTPREAPVPASAAPEVESLTVRQVVDRVLEEVRLDDPDAVRGMIEEDLARAGL